HSPIDPVFWRWHKWIDSVRRAWELSRHIIDFRRFAAVGRILFGIINDAPGVWIGPDGTPHPVPGGPGDPWRDLSPAARDLLLGAALHEIGQVVSQKNYGTKCRELVRRL